MNIFSWDRKGVVNGIFINTLYGHTNIPKREIEKKDLSKEKKRNNA